MTWLPLPGYEGLYEVSAGGHVRSVDRYVPHKRSGVIFLKGRVLSPSEDRAGYLQVCLFKMGVGRSHRVHRLVLSAFKPIDSSALLDANHLNGVKSDNRIENLDWVTRSENISHSYRTLGRIAAMAGRFGLKHPSALPVVGRGPDGVEVRFDSLMCAERAGYSSAHISSCLRGRRKTHGGLTWGVS